MVVWLVLNAILRRRTLRRRLRLLARSSPTPTPRNWSCLGAVAEHTHNGPVVESVLVPADPGLGETRLGNSHRMRNIDDLRKVKAGQGPDIVLWGSSTLYPQLLEANLIDRLLLLICPIVLGKGKKLFGITSHPVNMKLVSNDTNSKRVILTTYEPQSG